MKFKTLCVALCILILTGCTAGRPQAEDVPPELPAEFIFSSGVGAWMTRLTLNPDGTFEGEYHDSEMGLTGEDYPNGTVYICTFQGRFTIGKALDRYSRTLILDSLTTDERPEEEIRDGILFAAAGPHGLDNGDPEYPALGKTFVLYTPDTPVEGLDEELLSWWPGRFGEHVPQTLECYALWNTQSGAGFFAYPDMEY